MSQRFTSVSGRCASRKRKRRFVSERKKLELKERSTNHGKKKSKLVVEEVNKDFEGSNNMMVCAGVETAAEALVGAAKMSSRSCFIDFGCSAGGMCLYMAQRYGCKVYGVDKNVECIRLAREAAQKAKLSHLCTFLEDDFTLPHFVKWFHEIGATHVFA